MNFLCIQMTRFKVRRKEIIPRTMAQPIHICSNAKKPFSRFPAALSSGINPPLYLSFWVSIAHLPSMDMGSYLATRERGERGGGESNRSVVLPFPPSLNRLRKACLPRHGLRGGGCHKTEEANKPHAHPDKKTVPCMWSYSLEWICIA